MFHGPALGSVRDIRPSSTDPATDGENAALVGKRDTDGLSVTR